MNLFLIQKASCSYSKTSPPVLEINELKIPHGKMVFITGASGTGKSTILESLGLMNNTLQQLTSETIFNFTAKDITIDYNNIWQKSDIELSKIRKNHFAFIFQSSNLIPYISVYQNLSLVLDLKGVDKTQHDGKITEMLIKVGLQNEIKSSTMPVSISGGQRQRVAIARALLSEPDIIFGDEPTGSLDRPNARKIFKVFKNLCEERGLTALIVSHDIELTVEFADEIIIIEKMGLAGNNTGKKTYGLISDQSHYLRVNNLWNNNAKEQVDMFNILLEKISGNEQISA
jgi:ABC-type lipoprotein export system ATPase subunit